MNRTSGEASLFRPDFDRAKRIDQDVREGLAASLARVFDQIGPSLGFDVSRAGLILNLVRTRPIAPRLMATYADLVETIYADDEARTLSLLQEIADTPPPADGLRILTLTDEDLGAGQAERYARYALADSVDMMLAPIDKDLKAEITLLFDQAISLLDKAAPELALEIRTLVRELVLVKGVDAASDGFDGATTFYLWGALFLNAQRIEGRVQLAVAIAHEAAHAFLFGINLGARLTENLDEEVCESPLRAEPRPIEGVFHASFVLARMIYALDRISASGLLDPDERLQVEAMRRQHVDGFRSGMQSLAGLAKPTPLGAQILAEADAYVSAHP